MSPFNKAFVYFLKEKNMTKADFTRASGFGSSYVSQLCNGKVTDVTLSKAAVIVDVFGITFQDLWYRIEYYSLDLHL